MKEWTYTFDPVSKEEWIRQIEADLRQKPVESLQSEWWPGQPLIPLVHPDDLSNEIISLPGSIFSKPPIIAEWISTEGISASSVNQKILDALKQGAQSIIVETASSKEPIDQGWLKDVYQDMITVSVQPDTIIADEFFSLPERMPNLLIRLERKEASPPLSLLLQGFSAHNSNTGALRFIYRFPSSGEWDKTTRNTLNRLLIDLAEWKTSGYDPETFFRQCILSIEADKAYFKHIIQARVLHLLWYNLKAYFTVETASENDNHLECHIESSANEIPDHFLIRASMSSLAASLSGTNTLCIHHAVQPDIPEFYERIHRNIHHLLSLESGMYKGRDPLAGAYAIDYHTGQWTQKIWEALLLEK